jgi:hypothetical protein
MGPGADSRRERMDRARTFRATAIAGAHASGAYSRRGRVGPGADSGRTRVGRKHKLMGAGG